MNLASYINQHLPAGPERDEVLALVKLGLGFRQQQVGRRHGYLFNYLVDMVGKMDPPWTFDRLLKGMEFEARRRELLGEYAAPVESVSRDWEIITYHDPRKGRQQVPFSTLRNKLTDVKKFLRQ